MIRWETTTVCDSRITSTPRKIPWDSRVTHSWQKRARVARRAARVPRGLSLAASVSPPRHAFVRRHREGHHDARARAHARGERRGARGGRGFARRGARGRGGGGVEAEASREREARASRHRPSPLPPRRADASRAPRTPLEALEEARRARAADDDVRRVREAERMRAAGLRPPAPRASARARRRHPLARPRARGPPSSRTTPAPSRSATLFSPSPAPTSSARSSSRRPHAWATPTTSTQNAFARARGDRALRWHPDKFQRSWIGPRLAERADRERAIQTARDVYESAQAAFTARTRPA